VPLPNLKKLIGAFAAFAVGDPADAEDVVVLELLRWNTIIDWFKSRKELKEEDKKIIGFTVREQLGTGNHSVIQGLFNKENGEVVDGVKYEAKDICDELKDKEELIIYT